MVDYKLRESNECATLELRNDILLVHERIVGQPDAVAEAARANLLSIVAGAQSHAVAVAAGLLSISGNADSVTHLWSVFDRQSYPDRMAVRQTQFGRVKAANEAGPICTEGGLTLCAF